MVGTVAIQAVGESIISIFKTVSVWKLAGWFSKYLFFKWFFFVQKRKFRTGTGTGDSGAHLKTDLSLASRGASRKGCKLGTLLFASPCDWLNGSESENPSPLGVLYCKHQIHWRRRTKGSVCAENTQISTYVSVSLRLLTSIRGRGGLTKDVTGKSSIARVKISVSPPQSEKGTAHLWVILLNWKKRKSTISLLWSAS